MQRETLEIWARLGVGDAVAERGIQWRVGRTYHRGRLLFETVLADQPDEHFPPFVNISQSEVEGLLVARARGARSADPPRRTGSSGSTQDAGGRGRHLRDR